MSEKQEPKYDFQNGCVINRASGDVIPDDEPVFIFRARDLHALEAIEHYACQLENDSHRAAVELRIAHFAMFAARQPDRMKQPDTDTSGKEWSELRA